MATEGEHVFAAVSRMRNLLFRNAGTVIRTHGLTVTQFEVLEALSAHGRLCVGQIVDVVFGTPGNIPVVVKNLERDGLARRERSPRDGRITLVSLTERGQRVVEATYPEVVASIDHDLAALSSDEKSQLEDLLRKAYKSALDASGAEGSNR